MTACDDDPAPAARHWRDLLRRPAAALWSLALLATLAALWAGRSFVVTVVTAVALAVLLWPVLQRVQAVLRARVLAAAVALGVATALGVGLAAVVSAQLSTTAEHLPDALRLVARDVGRMESVGATTVQRTRQALAELDRNVARVTGTPRAAATRPPAGASGSLVASAVERSTGWMVSLARNGLELALQAGVVVMLAFFLLCGGDRLARRLSNWVDGRPLARGRFSPLVSDLAREVRRYGAVTLVTNALIGVAVALGFAAFGVPAPWSWGLTAAALHFVPYAGIAVTMVLAAVEVYVLQESWPLALMAATYVAGVGVVVGSALATWLQGRASRIDSALMFGGTVFFAVLWGGWGLLLGPLLVVTVNVIAAHARTPATDRVPQAPADDPPLPVAAETSRSASVAAGGTGAAGVLPA
jgi:predicted PurR-regulated permease PerM